MAAWETDVSLVLFVYKLPLGVPGQLRAKMPYLIPLLILAWIILRLTVGPFIRGKIRRELYHLYEHVLTKTRTARINGSRLISVLDSFSCEFCP